MDKATIVETLFNCTPPTRQKAYLLLIGGGDIVNGAHTANMNLTTADHAKYATGSDAVDPNSDPATVETYNINKGWRFDGATMLYKEIPAISYKWLRPNKWKSAWGNYGIDTYVGPEMSFLVDGTDNGYFSDGEVFAHAYRGYGATYMINGEQTGSWSKDDAASQLTVAIKEWDYGIKYLENRGYDVTVIGLLLGFFPKTTSVATAANYKSELEGIVSTVRAKYSSTLPVIFVLTKPTFFGAVGDTMRTGILSAAALDSNMAIFDGAVNVISNVPEFLRTKSVVNLGKFCESYIISKRSGLSLPSVSNISISGTLKVGQVITPIYTFTGTTEGDSNYILVYADNNAGLNETFSGITVQKGETIIIPIACSGKYIKIVVTPAQTTNPKVGLAVRNANWEGPVSA